MIVRAAMLVLFPASFLAAAETCPWLNSATAAGIIGEPVTFTVSHPGSNMDEGVCEFKRVLADANTVLRVQVATMTDVRKEFPAYLAPCGVAPEHLRALGNEAVTCPAQAKADRLAELLIGRVRNRVFLVRIGTSDPAILCPKLREQLQLAAEQVSGALF